MLRSFLIIVCAVIASSFLVKAEAKPTIKASCWCEASCSAENKSFSENFSQSNFDYIVAPTKASWNTCESICRGLIKTHGSDWAAANGACGQTSCTYRYKIGAKDWRNGETVSVAAPACQAEGGKDNPTASGPVSASCCPLSDKQDVGSTIYQIQTTDVNDPFTLHYLANANRDQRLQNYLNYVAGEMPNVGSMTVNYKLFDVTNGVQGPQLSYAFVAYDLIGPGKGYPSANFFALPPGTLKVNTLYRVMTEITFAPKNVSGSYTPIRYADTACKDHGFEFMIYYKELKTSRGTSRSYFARIIENGETREVELSGQPIAEQRDAPVQTRN